MADARLREFASERQIQFLDAIEAHGSHRRAATALGVDATTIHTSMKRLSRKAALQGYSPDHDYTRTVPEGFVVKGVSNHYNGDGKLTSQWVKGQIDREQVQALMAEMWSAFADDLPKAAKITPPKDVDQHLCNLYTFTDYHMGMLAWHKEGGADWDLNIATRILRACFIEMMRRSPKAKKCVINLQGDFLHTDGLTPVTPGHGHVLDADSRFRKIAKQAVLIIREMVNLALELHEEVELLICEGNHDESSSLWLQICFGAFYEGHDRVTVHDQALPYYAIKWGDTMLAFHHGHKLKNEQLPGLFAAEFSRMWGETTRRYCNTGHRHHLDSKELAGMIVTQHPTLSARDAYASRGGWFAERAAIGMTFHDQYGKWDEKWITPQMVMSEADGQ